MRTLLKVQTSIFGAGGTSTRLVERFSTEWVRAYPGGRIIVRDLASHPIPYLDAETFAAFNDASMPTHRGVTLSDTLINELERADDIALGAPMYNFNIPSALRTYFDYVVRAGKTFRYTAAGSEGLLKGKRAYIFISRGGQYDAQTDMQTQHLHQILAFMGIAERHIVYAEGMALGPSVRAKALASAEEATVALLRGIAT